MLTYSQRSNLRKSVLDYVSDNEVFVFDWYNENYMVSNLGNVKNVKTGKLLKPTKNNHGYYYVKLYDEKKTQTILLHRLVARNFLYIGDFEVNHINADKSDNRLINLELTTRKENIDHARRLGLFVGNKEPLRFKKEVIEEMKEFRNNGFKLKEIAAAYGTSSSYLCRLFKENKYD